MSLKHLQWIVLSLLLPVIVVAAVESEIGFLVPRFQIFPIGDIVDLDAIENGEELTLDAINEFFYIRLNASQDMLDEQVYIHLWEDVDGQRMINFKSTSNPERAFTIGTWVDNSRDGQGTYRNSDLPEVEVSDWFYKDHDETYYAEVDDVLDMIENGNLNTAIITLGFEVFNLSHVSLNRYTTSFQVYNPSDPDLNLPTEQEVIQNPESIYFNWTWASGGPTLPSDWTLIIVDGGEDECDDGEAVIRDRTPVNTRFEGIPNSQNSHTFTGTGPGETSLTAGHWHYWQVIVNVPTMLENGFREYMSEVRSFLVQQNQVMRVPLIDKDMLRALFQYNCDGDMSLEGMSILMELQDYEVTKIFNSSGDELDGYDFQLIQEQGFTPIELRLEDVE